ncbi:CHAT domain-containing protein [Russula compacta]|nr:CHAT domain-containing protein [Russula compacta]
MQPTRFQFAGAASGHCLYDPHLSSLLAKYCNFLSGFSVLNHGKHTVRFVEIDNDIFRYQNRLLTFPRPHPLHSECLRTLAFIRLTRYMHSHGSADLDKSISHSTEAILLPFDTRIQPGSYVIEAMFCLANALLLRSRELQQPGDVKHAIKYLRYLEDQSLETSQITCSHIKAYLVCALAVQVELDPVDPTRDIRRVATLFCGLLSSGVPESLLIDAATAVAGAICGATKAFGQPLPDEANECLRRARIRLPNLKQVRFALAFSLCVRFLWGHSPDDHEEATSIINEMIADPNEDVALARSLAGTLAWCQYTFDSKPEHLAETIFRTRIHLDAVSSEDPNRRSLMKDLADLEKRRFEEFGVKSGQQEDDAKVVDDSHLAASPQMARSNFVGFPLPMPDKSGRVPHQEAVNSTYGLTDPTDIEKAIEYCRLCLESPHSHIPYTLRALGHLLHRLFHLTGNIDYLQESITVLRDLIKMRNIPIALHMIAEPLIECLRSRLWLFKDRRDCNEVVELFTVVATDASTDVPNRFRMSCEWTQAARSFSHPATLTAYHTAISLMQESLSFAPTLEIQHFRLVAMRDRYERLPLDYASYLVQIGQIKRAIETLERGKGLLWSEMRGLRTSIDQLHAVNLPLAKKFAAVNRDLEALTISASPAISMEDGQIDGREGMDPFDRLVVKQRKLVEERDRLISQIRAQPGFDSFLIPPSFDSLRSAAAGGPVILINHSKWRSDIIILLHDSPPSLIPTSDDFYDHAKRLHDKLLTARNIGLDSGEYEDALEEVLKHLYHLVGRPVIERLRELEIPEQSRVWWCPTSVFFSLPLHAMGPIPSNGPTKQYFSDKYISSYTPTLSALIESREPNMQPLDVPSMLLVVQPDDDMPRSLEEMRIIQAVCPSVETLSEKMTTPIVTLDCLRKHQFAHISCHGVLETGKPFDAFFELYEDAHLTLLDIVRSQLPSAEFAFLSACHTAEITEESIANEGLHLAAAVQYSGFRSVVGTMWAVADIDGPVVARSFYKSVFSDEWQGVPYYERTAKALRDAVRDLRGKKDTTLESWVNYVHYGA